MIRPHQRSTMSVSDRPLPVASGRLLPGERYGLRTRRLHIGFAISTQALRMTPQQPRSVLGRLLTVGATALCSASILGCSGPTDAQVAADFAKLHSGCKLTRAVGGESEGGALWVDVWGNCTGVDQRLRDVFRYVEKDGEWIVDSSSVQTPICLLYTSPSPRD